MRAAHLLARLEALAVKVEVLPGDRLAVEGPDTALNDDLVVELRENKAAVLSLLRAAPRPAGFPPSRAAVVAMARECGAVRLWSEAMAGEVIVARDEFAELFRRSPIGLPVFSLAEVENPPRSMPPECWRAIHAAKRMGFVLAAVVRPDGKAVPGVATLDEAREIEALVASMWGPQPS